MTFYCKSHLFNMSFFQSLINIKVEISSSCYENDLKNYQNNKECCWQYQLSYAIKKYFLKGNPVYLSTVMNYVVFLTK